MATSFQEPASPRPNPGDFVGVAERCVAEFAPKMTRAFHRAVAHEAIRRVFDKPLLYLGAAAGRLDLDLKATRELPRVTMPMRHVREVAIELTWQRRHGQVFTGDFCRRFGNEEPFVKWMLSQPRYPVDIWKRVYLPKDAPEDGTEVRLALAGLHPMPARETGRHLVLDALTTLGELAEVGRDTSFWSSEAAPRPAITLTSKGASLSRLATEGLLLKATARAAKGCPRT